VCIHFQVHESASAGQPASVGSLAGLTGLWQVSGRSDLSWEGTVRLDLRYVAASVPLQDANAHGAVESMNIVVVGEEAAGAQTVRLVEQSSHQLAAVLTGSGDDETNQRAVLAVARELGAPVLPAARVNDPTFAAELQRRGIDVLLNVHSLHLIDPAVLAAPRIGTFNLHPGRLPEYAGLNVPSWAIYHGETEQGVTLHWVTPKVDAGPIAFDASFPVTAQDTGISVAAKCVRHGLPLISKLLTLLAEDPTEVPRRKQDVTRRRYFGRNVPHHGWVPWHTSAEQVVNFIRACDYAPWSSPWGVPRTRSTRTGVDVDIVRASRTSEATSASPGTVGRAENDSVFVAAVDEWVLVSRARANGTSLPPVDVLEPGDHVETCS